MKTLFAAALLTVLGLATTPDAMAQSTAPDFPTASSNVAPAKPLGRGTATITREQRRAQMSPEEAKRDEQMQILEARTGNTSFSRGSGPERQMDSKGAFMVRQYKAGPTSGRQERGQTQMAGGMVTHGKPLVHNHGKKKFLFF